MVQEIWKDIPGLKNEFQASNLGRIKSLQRKVYAGCRTPGRMVSHIREEKIRMQSTTGRYLIVRIKGVNMYVHRLVALAFINNHKKLPQINHKDGNKLNNIPSNLEWCTSQQNIIHSIKTGLRKPYVVSEKQKENQRLRLYKKVKDIQTGVEYKSITEAAKSINISISYLSGMLNGRLKNITTLTL